MRVLAAVDKFRGTATAAQVAASIGHACWENGHECIELPIADGGEGTLEVLGGPNRTNRVTNPLGKHDNKFVKRMKETRKLTPRINEAYLSKKIL